MDLQFPPTKKSYGHILPREAAAQLLEKLPAGAYTCDPDGLITYFNQQAVHLWGRTPRLNHPSDRFCGSFRIFSADGTPLTHDQCWMALALKHRKEYLAQELIIERPNGTRVAALAHANPIHNDAGLLIGAVNILVDISQRKKTEEAINTMNERLEHMVEERTAELKYAQQRDLANLQRFRSMITNLSSGAVALDENDIVIEANDLFRQLFHSHTPDVTIIGLHALELAGLMEQAVKNPLSHRMRFTELLAERKHSLQEEVHSTDGRILLRDCLPVAEEGMYRGMLLLFRDVTQERKVDRTKSEFMSLASHQLRTPLTAIRWSMSRLSKKLAGKIPDSELALFQQGCDSAVRMASTIDTMLEISRIEAGQVQIQKTDVDLSDLIRESVGHFRQQASNKQQHLTYDCPPDLRIKTDPKFLEQILDNLIGNALKYTPENGDVHVTVSQVNNLLSIAVHDTGYGIPKVQQDNIFRKFFRGDNVVMRVTEGTGLGLYLTSLIAPLLGGLIGFSSEEGKGSVFTFTLPLNP